MRTICKHKKPSDICGICNPPAKEQSPDPLDAAAGSAHLVKRVSRMNGDEITAAIEASHPTETEEEGVMDADVLAMHLVGGLHGG